MAYSYPVPSMTTVTVVAKYEDLITGRPARGKVRLTPETFVISADGSTLLVPTPFDIRLDARGWLELELPVVDDPDFSPPFRYRVEELLRPTRLARKPYYIAPDGSEDPLDLLHSLSITQEP